MTDISPSVRFALATLAVVSSYLMGSIPFGYLIARAVKGIDIRTVGSGNLGATNVGRVLGARFFWLVLALDLLKGLLPTLGFPWLINRYLGAVPVDLPVLIGMAAILGHTFPVYLKFRGGKGVATSVGVVLALDPFSCALAAIVFGMVLVTTRYMSLASLVGGVGFAAAHLLRQARPLSREHIAMSLFSIAVVALLVARHRSNLARIRSGTENRVNLFSSRRRDDHSPPRERPDQPSGRIVVIVLIVLVALSIGVVAGVWLVRNANRPVMANAGPWALRETDRLTTGQQRVERVAFAPDGERLAGICPRYNRLLTFQVDRQLRLRLIAETQLEGRPVSIVPLGNGFLVLQRPAGDQKHLEPGWWEMFGLDGTKVGTRNLAGFYPDDFARSPDGHFLYVLSSGRAEGDRKKPMPSLDVVAIDRDGGSAHSVGRLDLDPSDDPMRMTLSASGRFAAVYLAKSKQSAAFDLRRPEAPKLIGRTGTVTSDTPYLSASPDADWIMMPGTAEGDTIALGSPDGSRSQRSVDYVIATHQGDSALEISQARPQYTLGRFPIYGPFNLGRTRPTGLAYSAGRGVIAVATRSGSIHLIELRSRIGGGTETKDHASTHGPQETLRR